MTERIYAEDIAKARGISVRAARDVLHRLAEAKPGKVRRDGRSLYTTPGALESLGESDGDRIDDLVERIEALRSENRVMADQILAQERDAEALTARVARLERRATTWLSPSGMLG